MSRRTVLLLAVTCGVAVGNIYFPQAISPLVASGLDASPVSAALVMTAAQLGYATGIFVLACHWFHLPRAAVPASTDDAGQTPSPAMEQT
jgi:multisubunit Na+/H+ antiporter MnhC subunit